MFLNILRVDTYMHAYIVVSPPNLQRNMRPREIIDENMHTYYIHTTTEDIERECDAVYSCKKIVRMLGNKTLFLRSYAATMAHSVVQLPSYSSGKQDEENGQVRTVSAVNISACEHTCTDFAAIV